MSFANSWPMFAKWQIKVSANSDAELIFMSSISIPIFQELILLISWEKFLGVPFSGSRYLKRVYKLRYMKESGNWRNYFRHNMN